MALTVAMTLTCGAFASCGNAHEKEDNSKASDDKNTAAQNNGGDAVTSGDEDLSGNCFVITLREDKAPITCENFEKLVNSGFYDGVTFHRVVANFMAQGGDPEGTGAGGSGENIKGEFSNNGVENDLKHVRGTVSMARSQENDSASSQFFICYRDCDFLDGNYAAFGEVSEGMEVVDRFLNCDRTMNQNNELASPVNPITITSAKMISADADGHNRAKFTVDFTEREFKEGTFTMTLHADKAPITCENFKKLVGEGFYDGLTFHRVVDDFMAQGGDPEGTGMGGSSETIKGEFSENGVDNDLKHVRGTVSMARSNDPDSASSQFFICYTDCSYLDGNYAAFGEVTEGMDVVDGFTTVSRGYTDGGYAELSVPGTPITIVKAEMIDPDENGNDRVQFTVKY
ncbi:Peptidyl-prolyl cis-trans isomerase (rotamase)-cyclophilin family [Ruminococcus albus]|uniref:peptidylprolyl isomerase n=2 Tax=Ruminococcus albus TaxID=1264 RepID=A0A1H7GW74_RUMAL|nr:peptidylprolyl isomerase [Ruminococcus albus]SEK42259.1 Peptidyl-prolyl cis-trans isomerase (rotamase)-cyclophilin family [Ruminococcus albus]